MSLTDQAYRDRKWGEFPELRKALEETELNPENFGFSTASYNKFDRSIDLWEIATAVTEQRQAIAGLDARLATRDIHRLCSEIQMLRDHLGELIDELEAIRGPTFG